MITTKKEELLFPTCPVRQILSKISDKWSMLVIFILENNGTMRFNSLQKAIPDISQKVLTSTLRNLENDGYIIRTIYPEVPPRVEYSLTERTLTLLPHLNGLIDWANNNLAAILNDRKEHSTTT
ncbi:MAG: helix-turn-helix transcriptional regulator [Prevotella nanceiensis]|nr:helix-turn-helix transcriptional regulator [Hoylesella nanceiensis]